MAKYPATGTKSARVQRHTRQTRPPVGTRRTKPPTPGASRKDSSHLAGRTRSPRSKSSDQTSRGRPRRIPPHPRPPLPQPLTPHAPSPREGSVFPTIRHSHAHHCRISRTPQPESAPHRSRPRAPQHPLSPGACTAIKAEPSCFTPHLDPQDYYGPLLPPSRIISHKCESASSFSPWPSRSLPSPQRKLAGPPIRPMNGTHGSPGSLAPTTSPPMPSISSRCSRQTHSTQRSTIANSPPPSPSA